MTDIEHPLITQANRTGYANMVSQKEHWGIDAMGEEILVGESVVVDTETGEVVLEKNLEDYLIEVKGFQYKTAD